MPVLRQRSSLLVICVLLMTVLSTSFSRAQEVHDDLMQEVLNEAEEHGHYDDHYYTMPDEDDPSPEEIYRRMEEEETRRQEEEARRKREELQRQQEQILRQQEYVRAQREAAFEAELAQMSAKKQKEARKQKRKDARIVRRVLRAAEKGDFYGVLGLHNREFRIPSRTIKIAGLRWSIPGISLFHISQQKIRRAYRALALTVHPDKNRDGRAEEAFIEVENVASILSDERSRTEYDKIAQAARQERNDEIRKVVGSSLSRTFRIVHRGVSVFRTVLGPFAFPVLILGSLII